MEKESNIYYHKYLKYKNKYLQAKKFLGGAITPAPINICPYFCNTAAGNSYSKFYKNFTREVLDCIQREADKAFGKDMVRWNIAPSGIYFKFNDSNYISVHTDTGYRNKFHLYQNKIKKDLAIMYNENGDLEIIKRDFNPQFWKDIDIKFEKLVSIIENCVNYYKIVGSSLGNDFDNEKPNAAGAGPGVAGTGAAGV